MFKFIRNIILVLVVTIFLFVSTAFAFTYESHFNPLTMSNWNQKLIKNTPTHALIKVYDKNGMSDILVLLGRYHENLGLKGYSYTYKNEHHTYIFNKRTEAYERVEGSLEDWYNEREV